MAGRTVRLIVVVWRLLNVVVVEVWCMVVAIMVVWFMIVYYRNRILSWSWICCGLDVVGNMLAWWCSGVVLW